MSALSICERTKGYEAAMEHTAEQRLAATQLREHVRHTALPCGVLPRSIRLLVPEAEK